MMTLQRPGAVCEALLAALDASEGRRRRRKRDTTPDAIGLEIKREILRQAMREDPDPDVFEEWLLVYCRANAGERPAGALQAMARDVLLDWRLAAASPDFGAWLARGAPSEDRGA
jgi:hypothetical protein